MTAMGHPRSHDGILGAILARTHTALAGAALAAALLTLASCVTEQPVASSVDEAAVERFGALHPATDASLPRLGPLPASSSRPPTIDDDPIDPFTSPRHAPAGSGAVTSTPPEVGPPLDLVGSAAIRVPYGAYDQGHSTRSRRVPEPPTDPQIERILDSLSLRRRIGQRFIATIEGDRVTTGAGRAVLEAAPAGFIVYPWNFTTAEDVRRLTGSLQFIASQVTPGISLLISTDQEGGRVATFRFPDFVSIPSASTIGRFNDPSLVRSAAYLTSTQLRDLGVNMNLAPVLDLVTVPDRSVIGDRSYGYEPQTVARFVAPFVNATREAGIIATAKHFPGHGVTRVDSHLELPIVATTRDELFARDLVPFVEAIRVGVPAIMTGHLLFEQIDPFYPVTISRTFLHDLLRHELGFQGVVVTDGLEMGALRDHYSLRETLIRLFRYDVDLILLYHDYDVVELVDLVEELVRDGAISTDDVDRGVRRVLAMKREYGLIDPEVW